MCIDVDVHLCVLSQNMCYRKKHNFSKQTEIN